MDGGDAWVLMSTALVLFMVPGLALFYGGMVRSKNVLNMLLMNLYCLAVIPLLWVTVGASLSGSGSRAASSAASTTSDCGASTATASSPPPS
jgi:Amt family ammonium transporter